MSRTHRLGCIVVCLASMTFGCGAEPEPEACDLAVKRATQVYLDCVAGLGLEVDSFRLSAQGDIDVQFAEGTTEEQAALAVTECEPPMEQSFAITALACETVEVGRPASVEQLRAAIDEAEAAGFSGTISIVRDGELLLEIGVGLADRELGVANEPTTAFDVGSIMKDFTALAIYRLEADGLLTRADTLDVWLEPPADKAGITIQQLLDHTAGLGEYHDVSGDFEPLTRSEALERIFAQELLFAPGEGEAYSNSGYTLLAIIAEEASGEPFLDMLRALLDEGGFTDTGTYGDGLWTRAEVAVGYDALAHGARNSPFDWEPPTWALIGNGGLVSNVRDLDRLLAELEVPGVLPTTGQAAFREEQLTSDFLLGGDPVFAVGGANDFGFACDAGVVPDRGLRVVVASNSAEGVAPLELGAQLLMMAAGELIEVAPGQD